MLPRYAEFTKAFPNVERLAASSEDAVVEAWKGLGYYSRARNLRLAAKQIAEKGEFPREMSALLKLPGIGSYTAAAVLSIAFGQVYAVVDGNVKRVLSRLFLLDTPEKRTRVPELAQRLIEGQDPGLHNQAVMELGALVCISERPLCGQCPLQRQCAAFAKGGEELASTLPPKKQETKLPARIEFLVDQTPQGYLFVRDPGSHFLKNHWMLPARISVAGTVVTEHWSGAALDSVGSVRHTITRHAIEAVIMPSTRHVKVQLPAGATTARFRLVQGQRRAASSLMQKILSSLA